MSGKYCIAAMLFSMLLFGCESEQDKVIKNYSRSLETGKTDEAVSYLSRSAKLELEKVGGKSALVAVGAAFKMRKGIKSIKTTKMVTAGDTANVMFVYHFNDGSTSSDFFPMIKEGGAWKISK